MLEKTGVPTQAQIDAVFPDEKRLSKGPIAVIECFQQIPCDPCATACPKGAIQPFADINHRPEIDTDKCTGCILCMTKCPGLAIMCVDATWSDTHALVKLPYEFVPLPQKGQIVHTLDREGKVVADAEVVQVTVTKSKTNVVAIAVEKSLIKVVRNFRPRHPDAGIVCRCNDLDISEIRSLIAQGHTSIDEIKRIARLGMGSCQGRTCVPLVMNELSKALGIPVSQLPASTFRPMVKSIKLGDIAAYDEGGNDNA